MVWSLLLSEGCSVGLTEWAEDLAKLCMPQDKGQEKGFVSDTFARLRLVYQPPSGLQHPATGCLMHKVDVGKLWKGLTPSAVSFHSLFSPVPP